MRERAKFLWHTAALSFCIGAAIAAQAHYAPDNDKDDDDDKRRSGYSTTRRWDGWNYDWDRRWRRNWDNSWAPYDNDVPVRREYVNRYVNVNQNVAPAPTTQWSAISDPRKEIPNFQQVHHFCFRGGQPTEAGLDMLYHMGVRTVVSLRSDPQQTESERQLCEHHDLEFINIPLSKTAAPADQEVCRFMDVLGNARENTDRGAVFVHDHLGADRAGCMIGIYRILADKYSFEQAYNEMMQHGFHDNYVKLKQAVQKYGANPAVPNSSVKPTARAALPKTGAVARMSR